VSIYIYIYIYICIFFQCVPNDKISTNFFSLDEEFFIYNL